MRETGHTLDVQAGEYPFGVVNGFPLELERGERGRIPYFRNLHLMLVTFIPFVRMALQTAEPKGLFMKDVSLPQAGGHTYEPIASNHHDFLQHSHFGSWDVTLDNYRLQFASLKSAYERRQQR